jgi:flagellar protein FliL
MAAKPAAEGAETAKPKSKKMLIIVIVSVVLVLIIAAGVGALLFLKSKQGDDEFAEDAPAKTAPAKPRTPPVFLPLDNLVVNLGDPGGNRFAQVGITVQVADAKTSDLVKAFMPSVRNGILLILAQRTSQELLAPAGKEELASSILALIQAETGLTDPSGNSAVQAVLFSNFIVQ